MANFLALRELIYDLMCGPDKRHPLFNANSLYKRLERSAASRPPVSRTTFYSWFGRHQALAPPTAMLLECVPLLAEILNVNEYELYHAAGILPQEIDTAISLSAAIKANILESAKCHLVICSTFGPRTRALGSRVWGISAPVLRAAQEISTEIIYEVNQQHPVITIDYEDSDYVIVDGGGARTVDFNLLTDHVRFSAAEVLNLLLAHHSGPPAPLWGDRFDDLRYGAATRATIPDRLTRVRWCEVGNLKRPPRRR